MLLFPRVIFSQNTTISDSAKTAVAREIRSINDIIKEKGFRWQAGITSKSYLSNAEKKKLCGIILDTSKARIAIWKDGKTPEHYKTSEMTGVRQSETVPNWIGYMGRIKDQNGCPNCWAHAAAGVTIGLLHHYHGSNIGINLDEYDISNNASCGFACDSGTHNPACGFGYIYSNKVRCEQAYNQSPNYDYAYYTMSSYNAEDEPSIANIKSALQYSPVNANMLVYSDFSSYPGGIYHHTGGKPLGRHAIIIVSYNDEDSCWICKNSYGTG
jgi:hypothetical protein